MINYHELDEVMQLHLHSLELTEAYKGLFRIIQKRHLTDEALIRHLAIPYEWQEEVIKYANRRVTRKQLDREAILYYLVAGAPVQQIIRKLNVAQATVYAVKNKPVEEHHRKSSIEGFFYENASASKNVAKLLDLLPTFDGYRIPRFDKSWDHFKDKEKEEQERKRKIWLEEGWERV